MAQVLLYVKLAIELLKQEKMIKMRSQNTTFKFKGIISALFFMLFAANASLLANVNAAALGRAESIAIASKELSKKLQNDLVLKSVSIKFSKSEQYAVSKNQIGIRGEGTCRLDGEANDLPLNFDVVIDVNKLSASDVKYVFLNMEGTVNEKSVLTPEDIITNKLLQQIKKDFKTENIVLSIDYLNDQAFANGDKGFNGGGEIQVNGMGWRKFSFDVKAEDEKTKFSIMKYSLK